MRIICGHTTLATYSEGEFFNIPLWVLENEFDSTDENHNLRLFQALPLEKKKEMQNNLIIEMKLYHDQEEIEKIIHDTKLEYWQAKIIKDKYLVFPASDALIVVSIKKLGELYNVTVKNAVEAFLESPEHNQLSVHKIFVDQIINTYGFKYCEHLLDELYNKYHLKVESDKEFYGDDYY